MSMMARLCLNIVVWRRGVRGGSSNLGGMWKGAVVERE
jgi:hypothetical protein